MEREEMNGNENKKEETGFHLRVKLQINTDEPVLGPGVAELLELVGETGSMKEACGRMGMSYSKGWKIIGRAEEQLGCALIRRHHERWELLRHGRESFSGKAVQRAGRESEAVCRSRIP